MANASWTLSADQWSLLLALARMGLLTRAQLQQLCLPGKSSSTFERAMRTLQSHTPPLVVTHERAFDNLAAYSLTEAAREGIGKHPPAPPAFCVDGAPLGLANLHHPSLWKHDRLTNTILITLLTQARETGLSSVGIHYEVQLDPQRARPRADAILRIERHDPPCAANAVPWLNPLRWVGEPGWVFAVEADTGSERIEQVAQKADDYRRCVEGFRQAADWRARYGEVPIVLLVTTSAERLERINREWHARWPDGRWALASSEGLRENRWTAHLGATHLACRLFADDDPATWYSVLHDLPPPAPLVAPQPPTPPSVQVPQSAASTAAASGGVTPARSAPGGSQAVAGGSQPSAPSLPFVIPVPPVPEPRWPWLRPLGEVVWWPAWCAWGRVFLRLNRWRTGVARERRWGPLANELVGSLLPVFALASIAVLTIGVGGRILLFTLLWIVRCAFDEERKGLAVLADVLLALLIVLGGLGGWRAVQVWVPVRCWQVHPEWPLTLYPLPNATMHGNAIPSPPGEELRCSRTSVVDEQGLGWRHVRAGEQRGWVLDGNVRLTQEVTAQALPTVTVPTPPVSEPPAVPCRQLRLRTSVVATDGRERRVERLNVRTEPSLNAAVVATIGHEDVLSRAGEIVDGDGVSWLPVTLEGGQSGWASAAFLEVGQCREGVPAGVPSAGQ